MEMVGKLDGMRKEPETKKKEEMYDKLMIV